MRRAAPASGARLLSGVSDGVHERVVGHRRAYLTDRDHILPDDVKVMAPKVLRHHLRMTYEADARGIDPGGITRRVLAAAPAP